MGDGSLSLPTEVSPTLFGGHDARYRLVPTSAAASNAEISYPVALNSITEILDL